MKKLTLVGLAVMSTFALTANASTISVGYGDFSDTSDFQLNGNAVDYEGNPDNVLRLTTGTGQAGSAFYKNTFTLQNEASFSSFFSFRMYDNVGAGDDDGPGADGIVFALQPNSNTAGGAGGGIGYMGISDSLGIEFDTYNNGLGDGNSGNHVGINLNGSTDSVSLYDEPTRFNDGDLWNVWVDYDGLTDALDVRYSVDDARPVTSTLSYNIDLESIFGSTELYVGFTSGTGGAGAGAGAVAVHDITRFEFVNEFQPIETPVTTADVPAPASIGLLSLALLGVGASARKRKA